jgi:4-alpha-glucanotransferase
VIPERCAGLLVPLFSLCSEQDLGRGDFSGLDGIGRLAAAMGHRLVQFLPLDELPPGETSPYSALSVFALDPIHIAINQLPGVDHARWALARRETFNAAADVARIRAIKEELLEVSFRWFKTEAGDPDRSEFAQFASANREWADDYVLFRALKEKLGASDWTRWPRKIAAREEEAIKSAEYELKERLEALRYRQFVAQRQWLSARSRVRERGIFLGGDLAFSPCRDSAEVWSHQDWFDLTRSVGAPPDAFSATGQRWGLPMPDWRRMSESNFALLRARVRRARDLFDFVRIDHVVGLFRTYGYSLEDETSPGSFDPSTEDAQRAQGEEVLKIILEEAGTMKIIAEDLGVIPPFVRETLARVGIPGYKVVRWEKRAFGPQGEFIKPAEYQKISVATTGTHDTETLAQWWEQIEQEERKQFSRALGLDSAGLKSELDLATLDQVLSAIYAAPSELVVTPIQDLFGWKDRINVPGTITSSNWSWRLPFDPADFASHPEQDSRVEKVAKIAERSSRCHH